MADNPTSLLFSLTSLATAVALILPLAILLGNHLTSHTKRTWGLGRRIPGPKPLPFIGNALQMPTVRPMEVFGSWKQVYGDMIQLDLLGYHLIGVNSSKITRDLLVKRSAIYSDRPHFTFAGDICGIDKSLPLMDYGDENWKKQRRVIAQEFSTPSSISRYWPLQEQEARLLVSALLRGAERELDFKEQITLRLGVVLMRIVYGYPVLNAEDELLRLSRRSLDNFAKAGQLGRYMVDFFPLLKHVPGCFPGAGFKAEARSMKQTFHEILTLPFEWSKKHMVSLQLAITLRSEFPVAYSSNASKLTGKALTPNLVGSVLSESGDTLMPEDEDILQWAGITSVGAGMDTSTSAALTFFLAMIMHPEIQKKGQAEIDAVIGGDRLPGVADRPSLPFVQSVMTEVFRWNPPIPFGIPHATHQEDCYEGYHIPKDAIILPNIWYMMHDPEVYPNPMEFDPDRYHNDEAEMKNVSDHVFGFGRRVCPGMHFAQGALFAIIATTFATCNVLPEVDAEGKPILPELVFSDGVFSFPPEFKCKLEPRSPRALSLLADATAGASTE